MIAKHEKVFKDNIISYIYNRLQVESKDAVIAQEVMDRFPVFVGFTSNKDDQYNLIKFMTYGMRQMIRMNQGEDNGKSESV